MDKLIIRQGDLTFIRQGDSTGTAPVATAALALGEESGHWHEAVGRFVDRMDGDVRILDVFEATTIRVQPASHAHRHAAVTLPPGRYVIPGQPDARSKWLGQREYTPQGIRGSAD